MINNKVVKKYINDRILNYKLDKNYLDYQILLLNMIINILI